MGEKGNAHTIFFGRLEGKRSLGRPRCRWRMPLKVISKKQDGRVCTGFI
jgi:hypothetical protein